MGKRGIILIIEFVIQMGFDEISSKSTNITIKNSPQKKQQKQLKNSQSLGLNADDTKRKEFEKVQRLKEAFDKEQKLKSKGEAPPGPESYKIKYDFVEKKSTGFSFSKQKREVDSKLTIKDNKIQKTDDRFMLYPNIDAVRSNHHASKTIIKKPNPKPSELLPKFSPSKESDRLSEVSTQASEAAYLQKKQKQGISIAPIPLSKLSDFELERYLRFMLRKNPHLVKQRQIYHNPSFAAVEKRVPGPKIVSKKNQSVLAIERALEERRRPNVYTYSPDDRKVKSKLPLYTFPKSKKGERTPSPDRRKALIIDESQIRNRVPQIAILPEHNIRDSELLKEYEKTRLGPTSYKVSYNLTERRPDFGIVKIKQPINPINEEEEEDDRPLLYPKYDLVQPNKLVFKYYEPLQDLRPEHTPEKEMHPPRWKFYDYDLDAVREQVAKDIAFARNMSPEKFKQKEEFHDILVEHLQRLEKRPAVGQYDPDRPETKFPIDFSKAQGREIYIDPEHLKEMDIEGDVLILDPDKIRKRVPGVDFEKQIPREAEKYESEDINMHQELILEPNIDVIRKRKQFLVVDFDKQVGREERKHIDDDEYYVNNLSYGEIRPNDPADKKVVAYDFGKKEERFKIDMRRELGLEPDEVIIEPQLLDKKVKGNVNMDKDKVERFPDKVSKDPFYNDQPLTELNIDIDKAIQATKPNIPVVDFKRYEKVKEKEHQDLKYIREMIEEIKQKDQQTKKEQKEKFKVDKIFPQNGKKPAVKKGVKGVVKVSQGKTKKSALDADAEIDKYLKELGLD
ncbi:UNKNOWN [Stylonychia lemnae]|uniref:Uncharacterized protein n=1 Tax=Stylonychia lemnae TaxID=5949 RepID=A0A077ZXS2_STYLE|nr:UNKNOWN [Stylonychia lemnae]|eukprot:CDW74037.1 UNKNOWN [Stylonychia lemnae]